MIKLSKITGLALNEMPCTLALLPKPLYKTFLRTITISFTFTAVSA